MAFNSRTAKEAGKKSKRKDTKNKKTILKEKLGIKSFDDLKQLTLDNFNTLMNDKNVQIKALMTKEAAKYIYPQKKEIDNKLSGTINLNLNSKLATKKG